MIFGRIWGQGVEFFGLGVLVDWFWVGEGVEKGLVNGYWLRGYGMWSV